MKLLSTKNLQDQLGIGRDRAYSLMHAACFPSIKIGGRYYVTQEKLDFWLEKQAYKEVAL